MASARSRNVLSKTLLLSVLMIFLGISAATGGLNKAETTDLSDQNDVRKTILPLSQLNEPGFQEGSIFTDTTAHWVMEEHLNKTRPRSLAALGQVAQQ